jgi:hypothetical protein
MNRTRRSALQLFLIAVALAFTTVTAAPAGAATPDVDHMKLNLFLPGIEECGFTVNSVVRGAITVQTFVDRSGNVKIQVVGHVVSTLTNQANGKVVHVSSAGRDAFTPDGVVNADGTITVTDTLTGIDMRVYTSHSNTLLKDAGYLSMVTTLDSEGNVISDRVVVHGPHPFAGDFDAYCNAIAAAIG